MNKNLIDMKKCGRCKNYKELDLFNKDKHNKTGYCSRCRSCDKEYKSVPERKERRKIRDLQRRDEINKYQREYQKSHRQQFNSYMKKYADKNREKVRERNNKIYNQEKQKPKNNARAAKRRASRLQRTPKWLTMEHLDQITLLYKEAQKITKNTGILHTVDHIEPLQGLEVSGLHVPWNLQIMVGPGPNGNFALKNRRK